MKRVALLLTMLLAGNLFGETFKVLVFSKTAGFRHATIADGIALIGELATANGFDADYSENSADFTDANLAQYRAVVFLSTTGDILDGSQQAAFERFIQAGRGWAGVHAAADTEYAWAWYNGLLGAHFDAHPAQQTATIHVENRMHPSTAHLGATWVRRDEWYNYRTNPRPNVTVLLTLDESTYTGGSMGADHPIAWYHSYDGGRAWYTGLGHTPESYTEEAFRQHLLGGIFYAAGVTLPPPTRRVEVLVPAGSAWSYRDLGIDLTTAWRTPEFDDSAWASGPAKLGFGDGDHVTPINLGPTGNRYRTTYFRHRFSMAELPAITRLTVRLLRDDGAVVYLNGTEIGRSNMDPGAVVYGTFAESAVPPAEENTFFEIDATLFAGLLHTGENVLAVEIHQSGITSSDLGFDLALEIDRVIPPLIGIAHGAASGFEVSWNEVYSTAYGAVLEHASTPSNSGLWSVVPGTPVISGGMATQSVPAPSPSGDNRFFRLRYGTGTPAP